MGTLGVASCFPETSELSCHLAFPRVGDSWVKGATENCEGHFEPPALYYGKRLSSDVGTPCPSSLTSGFRRAEGLSSEEEGVLFIQPPPTFQKTLTMWHFLNFLPLPSLSGLLARPPPPAKHTFL